MNSKTVPVTFVNREGVRLYGMVHEPQLQAHRSTAILLLSPGVKMRVAPHRLYNKMAARFADLGYTVFRFDFHALGDSAGHAREALLADFYRSVQLGRYVNDTVAAMDFMQAIYGTTRFIAAGLCGGALTGLLAAECDKRVVGLMGFSIPVILDGSDVDKARYLTPTQLRGTRRRYLRKLRIWDPSVWQSWRRFLTFQSHYSLIYRTMPRIAVGKSQARDAGNLEDTNSNPRFAPAFYSMVTSSRPILLVFAGADRLRREFEFKFLENHQERLATYSNWYEIEIIEHANHVFSFAEWQQELTEVCCRWLLRQEPAGARSSLTGADRPTRT